MVERSDEISKESKNSPQCPKKFMKKKGNHSKNFSKEIAAGKIPTVKNVENLSQTTSQQGAQSKLKITYIHTISSSLIDLPLKQLQIYFASNLFSAEITASIILRCIVFLSLTSDCSHKS